MSPAVPLEFVMVSVEGPDRYAQAGGLGVRARELTRALAAAGIPTTLVFVGDPNLPGEEVRDGVRLLRWAQHLSRVTPMGVYQGEDAKVEDLATWLPEFLCSRIVRPAAERGAVTVILAEEWHTAAFTEGMDWLLRVRGLRDRCALLWNANNHFGFDRIDLPRIGRVATLTTVSRYMKHVMWEWGVNPVVIPNGIPDAILAPVGASDVALLRAAGGPCLAVKRGRFSADKRWHQAVEAIALLRAQGLPARLLMRGGIEPFGGEVLAHAARLGLRVEPWTEACAGAADLADVLAATDGPIIDLRTFLPDGLLPIMDAAATGVLANSGHEPFGLVGLEAMAVGGVAFVGATGEDYARPYENCIVVETEDAAEVAGGLRALVERPNLAGHIRVGARRDAAVFAWSNVVEGLLERLRVVGAQQGVTVPHIP